MHTTLDHSISPRSVHEEAFGTFEKAVCNPKNSELTLSGATRMANSPTHCQVANIQVWAKRLLLFPGVSLQLQGLTTHYLSQSSYITVSLISAGNKVPIWFPNWDSGQQWGDEFGENHKEKDTVLEKKKEKKEGLIWSSWGFQVHNRN